MCNNCQNSNCEDCGHVGMEYCTDNFCEEKLDSKCVIYKHNQEESNLNCITDIPSNTSVEQILEIWDKELCGKSNQFKDEKVSVTGEDLAGYLVDKVTKGDCVILTVEQGKLKISLDFACICTKLSAINCVGGEPECTPQALVPNIVASSNTYCGEATTTIVASNYNGTLQWFRNNTLIVGATTFSLVLDGEGGTYYVRNTTTCGSQNSNPITVSYAENCGCTPLATIPTITPSNGVVNENETILLTANGCNGNLSWYNSQNQIIGTGATKAVGAGSYYAKCTTNCSNANSNTVVISTTTSCPTISATLSTINPTCLGSSLQSNGEIVVNNIVNGVQISINGGNYRALNGLGSTSNSHKFEGLSAGSYTIRIKPQNSNCTPTQYVAILTSTTCGCPPINSNNFSVIRATCTGGVPNSDASIVLTGLINVSRVGIASSCNSNSWSTAQIVSGNSYTISNLAIGTYYIKYYTTENCSSSCITVNVDSNCCELNLNNPNVNC